MNVCRMTQREEGILRMLAEGNSPKVAAASLGIQRSTLHSMMVHIKAKLGTRTAYETVALFALINRRTPWANEILKKYSQPRVQEIPGPTMKKFGEEEEESHI